MVQAASYPPLQRTQGRGTHSSGTGRLMSETEARATSPSQVGPLNLGKTQATKAIIRGWSVGTGVQPLSYLGGQMQTSSAGSVGGLAVGTPGGALTGGYSICN